MDEFKKYLFENRDELDTEKPPRPQVWMKVRRQTQTVKPPVIHMAWKWSAAAAILIIAGISIYRYQQPATPGNPSALTEASTKPTVTTPGQQGQADSTTGTASGSMNETEPQVLPGNKTNEAALAALASPKNSRKEKKTATAQPASPVQSIEDNYATIINYQLKKLENTPIYTESAGYFHVFKKQWLDLEREEKKAKQDIKLLGLHDQVVNKLIRLYQQKMWLLKELQSEINKMNVRAKQYPDLMRSNPAYLKL